MKTRAAPRTVRRKPAIRRGAPAGSSLLPLHHRIYIVLRRKLLEGSFALDEPLPGEHQLAARFKASRETVRRVLDRLATDGLVDRRHGSGTFPLRSTTSLAGQNQLVSYYDFIAQSSHSYVDALLQFGRQPTPAELLLEDPRFGPEVLRVSRLRSREGQPVHVVDNYVPGDLAQHIGRESLGNRTVLEMLRKHGIEAETSEMSVGAVAADADEARYLQVEVGAPLVHATRVSRDASGRAVEFSRFHSVAGRFGYRFKFDRNSLWAQPPGVNP